MYDMSTRQLPACYLHNKRREEERVLLLVIGAGACPYIESMCLMMSSVSSDFFAC